MGQPTQFEYHSWLYSWGQKQFRFEPFAIWKIYMVFYRLNKPNLEIQDPK